VNAYKKVTKFSEYRDNQIIDPAENKALLHTLKRRIEVQAASITRLWEALEAQKEILSRVATPERLNIIITEVSKKHGFEPLDIIGPRQQAPLVRARQEAYWRCVKETKLSYPAIGRAFGNRDHTTIMWGAKRHEARMKQVNNGAT